MARRKTNEEFINEVYNIVKDDYIFLEEYIGAKAKLKCRHNICGYEYYVNPSNFLSGKRCPKCFSTPKKENEKFEKEVYELVGNEYTFLEEYINNSTKIKCRHNFCGHEYYVRPYNFLEGKRCPQCSRPNYNRNTKQFRQEVYELVGSEYEVLNNYVNAITKIKIKHNTCGHIWDVYPQHFLSGSRCPECMRPNFNRDTEQFKLEIFELVGSEYKVLGEYVNNYTPILIEHNTCGHKWNIRPSNFLSGRRCPKCFGKFKKTNTEFLQEVYELVEDEYTFLEEYIDNKTPILCRHNICGHEWKVRPINFLRSRRCPQCAESKGEQVIREYLKSQNITFAQEYSFNGLTGINGGLLRFDFAIFNGDDDLQFLIEYDGEFHFKKYYEKQKFEDLQIHDKYKNQYCKDNSIPLLRIPYWRFNSIEKALKTWLIKYNLLN